MAEVELLEVNRSVLQDIIVHKLLLKTRGYEETDTTKIPTSELHGLWASASLATIFDPKSFAVPPSGRFIDVVLSDECRLMKEKVVGLSTVDAESVDGNAKGVEKHREGRSGSVKSVRRKFIDMWTRDISGEQLAFCFVLVFGVFFQSFRLWF